MPTRGTARRSVATSNADAVRGIARLNLLVDRGMRRELRELAARRDTTLRALATEALRRELAEARR